MGSFNKSQMAEIREGTARGVDTSIYAHSKYNSFQMREIRLGLEKGLNVSIYANSIYSGRQMEQIRLGLEEGVNTSIYDNPKFNADQMDQLRWGLENGVDVSIYTDKKYDWKKIDVSVENDLGLEKEHAEIALAGLHTHTLEDFMDLTGFTSLETLPDDFKNHKEFMLQVLGETNDRALDLYVLLPENLQHDVDIIRTAIHYSRKNTSESFLDVAPDDLKRDLDCIEKTLNSSYVTAGNKETLMNVFSIEDERAGEMLKYASEALRDDPEVVAAAVLRNPQAIKFASERIQKNPDLLKPYQKKAEQVAKPNLVMNKPIGKGLER